MKKNKLSLLITLLSIFVLSGCLPTVDAGGDRKVVGNSVVELQAVAHDTNGYIAGYTWTQIKGDNVVLTGADSPVVSFTAPDVGAPETLNFKVEVTDNSGFRSSDTVKVYVSVREGRLDAAPAARKLNDTGVTFGGEAESGNNADCRGVTISAQDCSHGRDSKNAAEQNKVGRGAAGFDYTKLDSAGNVLANQDEAWSDTGNEAAGTKWSCVRDNVTDLVWEVKTDDSGLHDKDDAYFWYDSNSQTNGGNVGYENEGPGNARICLGFVTGDPKTYCNTEAYVARVNKKGLCGATDWRLPDMEELGSIVHRGATENIDTDFFPNTKKAQVLIVYATSVTNARDIDYTWGWTFGQEGNLTKEARDIQSRKYSRIFAVRLVRDRR